MALSPVQGNSHSRRRVQSIEKFGDDSTPIRGAPLRSLMQTLAKTQTLGRRERTNSLPFILFFSGNSEIVADLLASLQRLHTPIIPEFCAKKMLETESRRLRERSREGNTVRTYFRCGEEFQRPSRSLIIANLGSYLRGCRGSNERGFWQSSFCSSYRAFPLLDPFDGIEESE